VSAPQIPSEADTPWRVSTVAFARPSIAERRSRGESVFVCGIDSDVVHEARVRRPAGEARGPPCHGIRPTSARALAQEGDLMSPRPSHSR
jgi:hypothetical protein